jgi:hypothetical protein
MHRQLSLTTRRLVAGLLAAAGIAYGALFVATYQKNTAPSALGPDLREVQRLLFNASRPISPMERRLEASDTPLGTGPLISGPPSSEPETADSSMRLAFSRVTNQRELSAAELSEREGERQALLDWIRSGASRSAYEQDDYELTNRTSSASITPQMLHATNFTSAAARPRVRIRSLIQERCVTCHNELDGDDTARLVPFDTYESVARYLVPDAQGDRGRPWLVAALFSLFPLAAVVGPAFAYTSHPLHVRRRLLTITIVALSSVLVCWLVGASLFNGLLAFTLVATLCVMVQWLASIVEWFGKPQV